MKEEECGCVVEASVECLMGDGLCSVCVYQKKK